MKQKRYLSIDEIIKSPMRPHEKLRKFFKAGTRFEVGIIKNLDLLSIKNGHPAGSEKRFEDDMIMEARNVGKKKYRWLVYTDLQGNQFGLSVEKMLVLHRDGIIEIESTNEYK